MRARLALTRAVALLALLVLGAPSAARAADETVSFTAITPTTVLSDQLAGQGLEFDAPAAYGFTDPWAPCGRPAIDWPLAPSDGVAIAANCPLTESTTGHQIFGRLTTLRSKLTMKTLLADAPAACSAAPGADTCQYQARLSVFDIRRNQLGSTVTASLNTAPGGSIAITRGANEIAYFRLTFDVAQAGIDDVTFNHYDVPPTPLFTLTPPVNGHVAQDGSVSEPVRVVRFNGSTGPIALSVGGAGIASALAGADVTPNPVAGTASEATVRLTGATDAPPTNYPAQLIGTPLAPSAGAQVEQAPFTVTIEPAIALEGGTQDPRLVACERRRISPDVVFGRGYDQPAELSFDGPARMEPSSISVVATPGTVTPVITATSGNTDNGAKDDPHFFNFVARSGVHSTNWGTRVHSAPTTVTGADTLTLDGPRFGSRPRTVIRGHGFCPGARVLFGNASSLTEADPGVGTDALTVAIPRTATTGRVTVTNPGTKLSVDPEGTVPLDAGYQANLPTSDRMLEIREFRQQWSLPFRNGTVGTRRLRFSDLERAFGSQVYFTIDPCSGVTFGLVDCGVPTPIPSPIALGLLVAKGDLSGGVCFGWSWSAQLLHDDPALRASLPGGPGSSSPNDLASESGPSEAVRDIVISQHVKQWSSQVLGGYVKSTWAPDTAADALSQAQRQFAQGRPIMANMAVGIGGHAVIAYDADALPGGGVRLWVLDPNIPYVQTERTNLGGTGHASNQTSIDIDAGGTWTYGPLADKGFRGNLQGGAFEHLSLIPFGELPAKPDFLDSLGDLARVATGLSAGGSGGARTAPEFSTTGPLLAARRAEASATPTGGTAAVLVKGGRDEVSLDSEPAALWAGKGVLASVRADGSQHAGKAILRDGGATVKVDGKLDQVTLVAGKSGSGEQAVSAVLGRVDGTDELSAPRGGAVTLVHTGPPTTASLQLASASKTGSPVSISGSVKLSQGDTLRVPAAVWSGRRVVATVRGKSGRTRSVRLAGGKRSGPAPKLTGLRAAVGGRVASLSGRLALPDGATAQVAWELRSASGRKVARGSVLPTAGELAWKTRKLAKGRYRLVVRAVALKTTGLVTSTSKTATTRLKITVR
jgi:hypothetical protein